MTLQPEVSILHFHMSLPPSGKDTKSRAAIADFSCGTPLNSIIGAAGLRTGSLGLSGLAAHWQQHTLQPEAWRCWLAHVLIGEAAAWDPREQGRGMSSLPSGCHSE
ncbi:hypothetical protein ABBQ32_005882 [Trebouxia sp. C0010 RCD-2024]